jgi:hypothetical protein
MDELLDIELRILLLRYGKARVSEALARLEQPTIAELESEIGTAAKRKTSAKKKAISAVEFAARISSDQPECSQALQALAVRYDNRAFLPHLRDVRRFLEQCGMPNGSVKSRADATRSVFTTLAGLGAQELKKLADSPEAPGESDYALLAKEIMGRRRD